MSEEYKRAAVLFSGGLDSAVLVADMRARGEGDVQPIYVSVGFAWEAEERAMAARLFASPLFAGGPPPVELRFDMRDVFAPDHWAVRGVPPGYDTPDEDVYIHGRNVILLSKAAVYLSARGDARAGARLLLGTLAGNPFADATPAFFAAQSRALSQGLAMPIAIDAPYSALKKSDVIARGLELRVPLELTLSCMQPSDGKHCGRCSKCRERKDAFREAAVEDPAAYVRL
jgi:7-cyano-7-deazaguanine synthase